MPDIILVGLGNPGPRYHHTRHNLGVDTLRRWFMINQTKSSRTEAWQTNSKHHAAIAQLTFDHTVIACLFPLNYMNKSGQALNSFTRRRWFGRNINLKKILIIHDDLNLPLGALKLKPSGSAGGHNGVRSIHQSLGTQDITRLAIGIGRPSNNQAVDHFVLGKFTPEEQNIVKQTMPKAISQISIFSTLPH